MIRMIKGVSGYRSDKSAFRYPPGRVVSETQELERDLVKAGLAVYEDVKIDRPIAVAPMISPEKVVNAVVKRRRHV